jgi:hypothetical protein
MSSLHHYVFSLVNVYFTVHRIMNVFPTSLRVFSHFYECIGCGSREDIHYSVPRFHHALGVEVGKTFIIPCYSLFRAIHYSVPFIIPRPWLSFLLIENGERHCQILVQTSSQIFSVESYMWSLPFLHILPLEKVSVREMETPKYSPHAACCSQVCLFSSLPLEERHCGCYSIPVLHSHAQ